VKLKLITIAIIRNLRTLLFAKTFDVQDIIMTIDSMFYWDFPRRRRTRRTDGIHP
jgi:hypothetical protein